MSALVVRGKGLGFKWLLLDSSDFGSLAWLTCTGREVIVSLTSKAEWHMYYMNGPIPLTSLESRTYPV